ncbi:MAG: hypothetical protein IPH31_11795 [Lewinellaceae bacterium]|nr:hypothetical protein [Lewinellaceae bacterium]
MNINRFYSMLVLLCLFFTAQQLKAQCDLIFTNEITDITCFGLMDGAIDVTISGGTPPFTYLWSNGQTNGDITGLAAGVYTLTATDALGCTGSVTSTINTSTNVLSLILNDDGIINCQNPTSDLVPDISGGIVPYTFSWSTGSMDDMIAVPSGGTYTVTITDAAGCTISAQKTINQSPSYPVADPGPLERYPTCATGPAMLGGPGSSIGPDFTYLWSTFTGSFDLGVDTTLPSIKVTAFGAYTLTVTNIVEGCEVTSPLVFVNPDNSFPQVTIQTPPHLSCLINEVTLNATGSTTGPQYSYLWTTTNGNIVSGNTTLSAVVDKAGTYLLTIKNNVEGCTKKGQVTVIADPGIPIARAGADTGIPCGGGFVTLDASGSSSGSQYVYAWNGPNGFNSFLQNPSTNSPGVYTLIVTNTQNGCTKTDDVKVFPGPAIPISDITIEDINCMGQPGVITLSMTQGTAPYLYVWSDGTMQSSLVTIIPGIYSVTVTDFTGCNYYAEMVVKDTPNLTFSAQKTDPDCILGNNGAIDLTATGVFGPFEYAWSTGETTQDLSNLTAGTYTVTVTYALGTCTQTLSVALTDSSTISLSTVVTDANSCLGTNGLIDLTVAGGTGPYSYIWSDGEPSQDASPISLGTFTVTVTDASGCTQTTSATVNDGFNLSLNLAPTNAGCSGICNGSINLTVTGGITPYQYFWSPSNTTQDISNLCPGTYTVTVSDVNGCTKTASTIIAAQTSNIVLTATPTDASCNMNNGSIDLTVTGGAPQYQYDWSDGETVQDRVGLIPGMYIVTVTDANACTQTASVTVGQTSGLTLSAVVTASTSCVFSNGTIDLTVVSTGSFTYIWSDGQTTQDLSNLPAGTYTVTVSDGGSCTAVDSYIVPNLPNLPNPSAIFIPTTCDLSNGSIDVSVTSGVAPYTFLWSNSVTVEDLTNITAGTYSLTVTGANGCTNFIDVNVTNNNLSITINGTVTPNTDCVGTNGSIDVTVTPLGAYTYLWSHGATSEDVNGLQAGTYSLTVSAGGSCTQTASFVVSNLSTIPSLVLNVTDASCNGNDGAIDLTVTGGTPVFTYIWSDGNTNQNCVGITAGIYTVTVTDATGCSQTASATVGQTSDLVASTIVNHVSCFGGNNGGLDLTVTGGTTPYTYDWSHIPGNNNPQDISNLTAGIYTCTITDGAGCTKTTSTTITQATAINVTETHVNVLCNVGNNGSIDLTVTGGTPGYTYIWSNGTTTQDPSGLTAGTYTCTVTDAAGCTKITSASITQPAALNVTETHINVLCNGGNNGSIDLTVTGGTPGYIYDW